MGEDYWFSAVVSLVFVYPVLQGVALWLRRGRPQMPERVVAGAMLALYAYSVLAYVAGANLWPVMLILLSPFACAAIVAVMLWRALAAYLVRTRR